MRPAVLQDTHDLAAEGTGVFAKAFRESKDDLGALVTKLKAAGLTVTRRTVKHGHWCEITDKSGGLVARGYSRSPEDALLNAVAGAIREKR